MTGSTVSVTSILKVAGSSVACPEGVVAVTWVVACISPWCLMGVPLMAHSSLVLVGSTLACGNAALLAQLVVAPESTIMYFVCTTVAAQ